MREFNQNYKIIPQNIDLASSEISAFLNAGKTDKKEAISN